jgi:hypothetical protein
MEGGFLPSVIFFFGSFYKSSELVVRLAALQASSNIANSLGHLLAAGLVEMQGIAGREGWFWLFCVEGMVVFLVGFGVCSQLPLTFTS